MTAILSVASECAPLIKTGGLADVVGALPAALAPLGIDMRVLLPGYPAVLAALEAPDVAMRSDDLFGGTATVLSGRAAGLSLLVLDAPHLFAREGGGIYLGPDGRDWPDNPERFAALSWIAARIAAEGADGWIPDLMHLHDWQAALAALYGARAPSILTIHNISFQGLVPADRIAALRLPFEGFHPGDYEYYGRIGTLKAGLIHADAITTVSPTYARELMTAEFGMGLQGVLRSRAEDLSGVLNGIDTAMWSPATDPLIAAPYGTPQDKAANTAALRAEFGLPETDGPLCVAISRLTGQKGLDLLLEALPVLLARGGQVALLGSGEPALEADWRMAADRHAGVAVRIGYDEALSHRLIAGGDAILVPSRFEPCGLTQLYGLRYGTLPLVGLTGGLADTVIPANPAAVKAGVATGFQFYPVTAEALADALTQLCDLWERPDEWQRMQRNAMAQPVGWEASARDYADLYRRTIARAQ